MKQEIQVGIFNGVRYAVSLQMRGCFAVALVCLAVSQAQAAEGADDQQAPNDDARVMALIEQLGDDEFFAREHAQAELAKLGFEAYDALSAAEIHDDIEISSRARYLMERMRWATPTDPPEVRQALKEYESADEAKRNAALRSLAELPPSVGLAALCRLVRYERSELRSKLAAVAVLKQELSADEDFAARAAAITGALGASRRASADWLRAYVAMRSDPAAAVAIWEEIVEEESSVLQHDPRSSQTEVVQSLLRIQCDLLEALGRHEAYAHAMAQMIELEGHSGRTEKLTELISWLSRRDEWSLVDDVAERFNDRIRRDPLLLYSVAEARRLQGDEQAAEETARQAQRLIRGGQVQHLLVALGLRQRSLSYWAEQELGRAIKLGKPRDANTLRAQFMLAEIQHDRDDNLAAAGVLEQAVASMEKNNEQGNSGNNADRPVGAVRARMLYFFSRAHAENAPQRARQYLAEAVEADPTDADVLIALYHLPDQSPEERQRNLKRIRSATEMFRQQIRRAPDDAVAYNQLAWLVGNTEGDFEEATRFSHKSLQLRPDTPGYYDTLAHCYFAQKDYQNAVRYQTKAVDGDPSSGLMAKKLEIFRKALADSSNDSP